METHGSSVSSPESQTKLPGRTTLHRRGHGPLSARRLGALYGRALPATRSGPLYTAFPYPTKISPEAIALYIAAHTEPGATIFDGFAGSGTTGLAALLCEDPPIQLRREASRLGLRLQWGPRNAVLYEIGSLGAFVAQTLTNPPDPQQFNRAASQILGDTAREFGWLYSARDPFGGRGDIRHVVWSDVLQCPRCRCSIKLWDSCVSIGPARIASQFRCTSCDHKHSVGAVGRFTERVHDDILNRVTETRLRTMARVYGVSGSGTWSREPRETDLLLLDRVAHEEIPTCVPTLPISWGDLYRSGYHRGISHVHHFYTRRNLIAFGRLWERADAFQGPLRDALRFWLLSYNASHATMMSRVVAKSGQPDLVVTSAQPGVLYVSGLPVEKNVFRGLGRKLSNIGKAFASIHGRRARVSVRQESSRSVDLPNASVDYVFTDPPFGANIPYSEISLLNESWLGRITDSTDEAIVNRSQRKTIDSYQRILTDAFAELNRILRPDASATMVFHSASASVWNALRAAYTGAGFCVEYAGVLDKKQGSFKQVTTNGSVRGDPVLLLRKQPPMLGCRSDSVWRVAEQLHREALELDPAERTPERLYSRFVNYFLTNHQEVPIDANEYYRWHIAKQAGAKRVPGRSSR